MATMMAAMRFDRGAPRSLPKGGWFFLFIFGPPGALPRRKLIPALYDLDCIGCIPTEIDVLGIGRTPITTEEFRVRMREAAAASKETHNFNEAHWSAFAKRLFYLIGDPNDARFYSRLRTQLEEMRKSGSSGNHLFYISTPASVAHPIIEGLGVAGLNQNANGWSRIVLEKPFGRDLRTALELNTTVLRTFSERDSYRTDHHLGKETFQ